MILDIVTFPAKSLREKSKPIEKIDETIKKLIEDMIDTLYEAKGYGLAAPQVGHSLQLIIADETAGQEGQNPLVFINPKITKMEGEIIAEEGCLSVPGEYATVKRFSSVIVEALNEKGEAVVVEGDGQLARILQHEIDHLNGVLFIDKLPTFKRDTIKKHIKRRIDSGDYVVVE